jgi:hypothetical protein
MAPNKRSLFKEAKYMYRKTTAQLGRLKTAIVRGVAWRLQLATAQDKPP